MGSAWTPPPQWPSGRPMTGQTYDVVVLGGGGAGLSAALSAAQRGARTLLVERQPTLGGSTAISIGSFTAAGTRWQRQRGIADSPEDFFADMAMIPGVEPGDDNPELRALLAVEAAQTLAWLSDLGVPFVGPFPEPPHRVPRMHNVVPDSRMYIAQLRRAARHAGVKFLPNASLVELRMDPQGVACVGAVVEVDGQKVDLPATRGVVVATGDFSGNGGMRRAHLSAAAAAAVPANPASTGDGQRLIAAIGGRLRAMHFSTGPKLRFRPAQRSGFVARLPLWPPLMKFGARIVQLVPPRALGFYVKSVLVVHMQPSPRLFEAGAILVNLNGRRFCDERESTKPLALEPDSTGYVILDAVIADRFSKAPDFISTAPGIAYAYLPDYARARPDLVHRARDAHDLAQQLGLQVEALEEAVRSATGFQTTELVALGPVVSTVTVTEGGALVDTSCRVIHESGHAIPGLFAAGGVAQGGMHLAGHGLHIAWAMTSGRIAGATAARRMDGSLKRLGWGPVDAPSPGGLAPP